MGANDKVAATFHGADLSEIIRKAKAEAWDEGRQWLAEQGGDVQTLTDPNPYRNRS